ncbi:motile sperm domain-containing protein 2-like [Ornithodoros turicata]
MPVMRPGDDLFNEHELTVTRQPLENFRAQLLNDIQQDPAAYNPQDVKRIRECDELCRRYVRHKKLDVAAAVEFAKHSLQWRKHIGINDLREEDLEVDFFDRRVLVPYNQDKTGSHLLMVHVKGHFKDSSRVQEMRKFMAYFMEKILYEYGALRVTILFDCTDAAIANFDMELIKFIIAVFKEYYPWALGHIIVYNMPWLFNAAWKIIKTMIPSEGVQRIKFVSKETLLDYVDSDKLPVCMGGQDQYVYEYVKGKPLGERCPVVTYPLVQIP